MEGNRNQLISIQYLRAIAALMVVLHHARNSNEWLFNPLEDYYAFAWGVDIFFVISGFIMYVAARKENAIDFLGRRLIRVVPLYWMATLALLFINTRFHVWWISLDDFLHLTKSLFFIPHYSPSKPDHIWPYLIPGWTLNYEMLFYAIFCLGLIFKRTLTISTFIISLLFFIGFLFKPEYVVLKEYTKPILLEFLCGIWIAYAYTKGLFEKKFPLIIIVGFSILFSLPFVSLGKIAIFVRILASSMIVAGALSLGKRIRNIKLLHLLGDASYSIYLTHTFISLKFCSKIWKQVHVDGWLQFSVWVILTLTLSSTIGIVVHLYLEKPVLKLLRSKWENIPKKRRTENVCSEIA